MRTTWIVRFTFLSLLALGAALTQTRPSLRWYKGNLHTHTLNSDGDSTPHEVATWYREHGYQFLTLSDHNYLTSVEGLNAVHAAREKFLLIPGEEVTDGFGGKPIHVNAYNLGRELQPRHGASVAETIQNNVNMIRGAMALPSLNHPNFGWAVTKDDLLKVSNLGLVEVYNGHPTVNNAGGGGFASLDEIWDALLTAGKHVNGIAVDDAHHFKKIGQEFSNPGRGWIQVRAAELSAAAIAEAIDKGDFYASSGVVLADVQTGGGEYRLEIATRGTEKLTTYFIGDGGKVLAKSYDTKPVYKLTGSEKYVRARVDSSFGSSAWTQAFFTR
ncbi:MAG: CehA/McbA family metallohydrolase [Acidobacteriota bacterium]